MGREATEEETQNAEKFGIPLTLGDPDAENPNLDLVDDDEEDDSPMLTAMQEQLDKMGETNKEEREFLQNTILSLSQQNAAPAAAAEEVPALTLDLEDLPDPVEKRADFNKQLGERINKYVSTTQQNFQASVTAQNSTTQSLQDLETRFTRDHGELAKKPALFQAVMTQQVGALKNRGLDAAKFVFADPDGFLKKVAAGMRTELGLSEDDELGGNEEDETAPGRKKVVNINSRKSKRLPRAQGVRAGSNARTPGRKTNRDKPTSFIDELKKQQLEMGIV